jgi:hypothetical protein
LNDGRVFMRPAPSAQAVGIHKDSNVRSRNVRPAVRETLTQSR